MKELLSMAADIIHLPIVVPQALAAAHYLQVQALIDQDLVEREEIALKMSTQRAVMEETNVALRHKATTINAVCARTAVWDRVEAVITIPAVIHSQFMFLTKEAVKTTIVMNVRVAVVK